MSDAQKFRAMDWVLGLALTALIGVCGWSLVRLVNISERVAVIESTRFTPEDADKLIQPKLDMIIFKLETLSRDVKEVEEKLTNE